MSSNYPPGVTGADIERMFADRPCEVCGHAPDDCICFDVRPVYATKGSTEIISERIASTLRNVSFQGWSVVMLDPKGEIFADATPPEVAIFDTTLAAWQWVASEIRRIEEQQPIPRVGFSSIELRENSGDWGGE